MKKLARLTALLLTGALLLVLTACGGAPGGSASMTPEEIAAKQWLLEEINSYRTTHDPSLEPLEEVKKLSKAEQDLANYFRAAGKTVLPDSETSKPYAKWQSLTKDWSYYDDFGWEWDERADGERISFLTAKVPANKAELWTTLEKAGTFDDEACKYIGIAVVTIDGKIYWACTLYAPVN